MARNHYKLQKINAELGKGNRVESGPLQVNDDWPGVFIRGDNAMFYGMALRDLLSMLDQERDIQRTLAMSPLYGLAELLASCNVNNLRKNGENNND